MSDKAIELLLCPFCGNSKTFSMSMEPSVCCFGCDVCDARVFGIDEKAAKKRWNTRQAAKEQYAPRDNEVWLDVALGALRGVEANGLQDGYFKDSLRYEVRGAIEQLEALRGANTTIRG